MKRQFENVNNTPPPFILPLANRCYVEITSYTCAHVHKDRSVFCTCFYNHTSVILYSTYTCEASSPQEAVHCRCPSRATNQI